MKPPDLDPCLADLLHVRIDLVKVGDPIKHCGYRLDLDMVHFVNETQDQLIQSIKDALQLLQNAKLIPVIKLFQFPIFVDNLWLASGYVFGVSENDEFWRVEDERLVAVKVHPD